MNTKVQTRELLVTVHDTPVGEFTMLVHHADGAVHASGWTSDPSTLVELAEIRGPVADLRIVRHAGDASAAVEAFLDGDLAPAMSVEVRQSSGPFIERAWHNLRQVDPGAPTSYSGLAARSGRPAAARAAGAACASNRVALFVPCHRVVRAAGELGGYRWGVHVKRWLLDFERASARSR